MEMGAAPCLTGEDEAIEWVQKQRDQANFSSINRAQQHVIFIANINQL